VPIVAGTMAIGPLSRALFFAGGAPFDVLRMVTPSCLDLLAAGALGAILVERDGLGSVLRGRFARVIGLGGAALFLWGAAIQIAGAQSNGSSQLEVLVVYTRWPFFTWLVLRAAQGFGGPIGRLLASRPLAFVGKVSYVFHAFALVLDRFGLGALHPLLRCAVYLPFTLLVAWLSWTFFESRFNALKDRFPYERAVPATEHETELRRAA
jgi:peptidoglycan/LPS O-acetylase OafA/YrhL